MDLQTVSCPREGCTDKHQLGKGNIRVHDRKRKRCRCTTCKKTFSYRRGTIFYRLRHDEQMVLWVVALVAGGCPVQAIVDAFGLDERTVGEWARRAGVHAEAFHREQMQPLDLGQVQVDEVKLKLQGFYLWVAMAIAVPSRLWLGAFCQAERNRHMAQQIMTCVYNWCQQQAALLITFDGWSAYPKAVFKLFREPRYTGRGGRPRQIPWPHLVVAQFVKTSTTGFLRQRLSGSARALRHLLTRTQGVGSVINTSYIERLNATFRAHLAPMARRTRCLLRSSQTVKPRLYLVGCLYNFCWPHCSLSARASRSTTPAMAAGLTDHIWSLHDLFWYRLKPYKASTV